MALRLPLLAVPQSRIANETGFRPHLLQGSNGNPAALPAAAAAAEPAPEAPPNYYRPDLDAVRFLAFGMVFLHHVLARDRGTASLWPDAGREILGAFANSLGFGLQLFFFLSAFLITETLLREKEATGCVDVRRFYVRRILRIWPLYYLALAIGAAVAVAATLSGQADGFDYGVVFLLYALMLGNLNFLDPSRGWPSNPFTPLWSISLEEQFYLVWPWVMAVVGRRGIAAAALVMLATSVATQVALGEGGANRTMVVWTNTLVQFQFFATGVLACLALRRRTWRPSWGMRLLLAGAALGLGLAANLVFHAREPLANGGGLQLVLGYLCITACVAGLFLSIWGVASIPRPIIHLGRISYGLYVFHLFGVNLADKVATAQGLDPILHAATEVVVGLGITVAIAAVSYRDFESIFLRRKTRFAFVATGPTP